MSEITPEQLLPEGFEKRLLAELQANPQGIDEFSLIRRLAVLFPDSLFAAPDALRQPLKLFQLHFLLFHLLYRLADRIADEGRYLEMHTLRIVLMERPAGQPALVKPDLLRAYYLDWSQWANTHAEDVQQLLAGVHQGPLSVPDDQLADALALFDLKVPASPGEIKKRYRTLVQRHHPDKGGEPGKIQAVNQALLILQRYYGKS
ncbi:MAG: DNA-J related domain-containing protein [Pseudoalteromonas distincta]